MLIFANKFRFQIKVFFFVYKFKFIDASINEVKASLLKSLSPVPPLPPPYPGPIGAFPPIPPIPPVIGPAFKGGCPLCDRSVYGYCSSKMIHDACCCNAGIC